MRALVAVAHGSPTRTGSDAVRAVLARVAKQRPKLEIRLAFLDHQEPRVPDAVTPDAVVVPLLLHPGQHVLRDLPALVGDATLTPPLAPEPRLARAAHDRLAAAGVRPDEPWTVIVAGAGSADPQGQQEFERTAAMVGTGTAWTTTVGYAGSGLHPSLTEAAEAADACHGRVAAVPFVLGAGFMARSVGALAARCVVVAAPLGDHPEVAATVLDRYDAGVRAAERAR